MNTFYLLILLAGGNATIVDADLPHDDCAAAVMRMAPALKPGQRLVCDVDPHNNAPALLVPLTAIDRR